MSIDQASEIIKAAPQDSHLRNIVLVHGSFHTFMNLLGGISTLMDEAGLKSILEEVYALEDMLNGKAVARASRGHLLVDIYLHQLLVQSIVDDNREFTLVIDETEDIKYIHVS